jgi:hypothetical protein
MTAKQFEKLLNDWDIPHKAIRPEWATHNREGHGAWGPVHGVVLHHTGSDEQQNMPSVLWSGYEGLPGPLCHGGISKAGVVLLSGWGRANHAGLGDIAVLRHVIEEDYTGNLTPKANTVDGNARFYGFEIMYSGEHEMSDAQMETSTRLSAAICSFHRWSEKSVIGHGEWQVGKWDPGIRDDRIYNMSSIRSQVKFEMLRGAHPAPLPTPPTPFPRTHTVAKGETPFGIAERELGDGSRWLEIVKLNPDIVVLSPGQKLKLPAK